MPEAWNRANIRKEVCRICRLKFIWVIRYGILPICPPPMTACSIHGTGGHGRLSAPAQMNSEKKRIDRNPVKAPLRHKHKRNGPCVISLKRYSFVQAWRKALFSAYAVVGNTFVRNSLSSNGVTTYQSAFTVAFTERRVVSKSRKLRSWHRKRANLWNFG